jgi:dihydroorotase
MPLTLIKNATLINEGKTFTGSVLIDGTRILKVLEKQDQFPDAHTIIEATGKYLIPGVIDDQVHFREPGLTHKGNINTESRAAVAGGVTSYMEMPNTNPQTTSIENLEAKYDLAANQSLANYSFYMGATNDNIDELLKVNPSNVCGVKIFMGSSTGNMLVDSTTALSRIFAEVPLLITTHCEDEVIIRENTTKYREMYGEEPPFSVHPLIRNDEACYRSSSKAVELATKYNTRLHILHLSSAKEMALLDGTKPLEQKKITGEVCVHHLWFDDTNYLKYGSRIKWNPAIKSENDKIALIEALKNNKLDVVATDHAPHTLEEKNNTYFKAPSGGPLVQHSLAAMLELCHRGIFTVEMVIEKMCHAPAKLYGIRDRGFIREGYYADLVLIDPMKSWQVSPENILYKCGWSPFEGITFKHQITHTWVNGELVYQNGIINEDVRGMRLLFNR